MKLVLDEKKMKRSACDENGCFVNIEELERKKVRNVTFYHLETGQPMMAKMGMLRSHHFSLKSDRIIVDRQNYGESLNHKKNKEALRDILNQQISNCGAMVELRLDLMDSEGNIKTVVADVGYWYKNYLCVIEIVQTHPRYVECLIEKQSLYNLHHIPCLFMYAIPDFKIYTNGVEWEHQGEIETFLYHNQKGGYYFMNQKQIGYSYINSKDFELRRLTRGIKICLMNDLDIIIMDEERINLVGIGTKEDSIRFDFPMRYVFMNRQLIDFEKERLLAKRKEDEIKKSIEQEAKRKEDEALFHSLTRIARECRYRWSQDKQNYLRLSKNNQCCPCSKSSVKFYPYQHCLYGDWVDFSVKVYGVCYDCNKYDGSNPFNSYPTKPKL